MGIDDFLVLLVDEGAEEDDGVEHEEETPERDELDQEVGEEGSDESLASLCG